MKIAMKGDMGDADEMALLVCRTARAAHVIAHEARQNTLIRDFTTKLRIAKVRTRKLSTEY